MGGGGKDVCGQRAASQLQVTAEQGPMLVATTPA